MPALLCSKCGFNNPPGMRFCGNCGSRLETGTAPLQLKSPPPSFNPDTIGVMMGADLLERFRKAGLEAAGQRRTVTILFVDLSGFTDFSQHFDNEETYVLIQQYISLLAKNVYKYDGMVDKFMGDGLMAIFGAPIAHENSAELAIRAALDMQTEMAEFSQAVNEQLGRELRLHIGLHSGPVIVGSIGSSMMMNYTAIGDTVNLAYRLEQHCPAGAILVSETTYQLTRALFDYMAVAPLGLKGIQNPVPAYRVLAAKANPGDIRGIEGLHAPLIGRDVELVRLKQIADQLLGEKKGYLVFIDGEAGIGKSRLTRELRATLPVSRVHTLVGHSYTYRRSVAYWIFLDLLKADLNLPANPTEYHLRQELKSRVSDLFGSAAEEKLPYLEALFSLKPSTDEGSEKLRYLDAAQLRQQIFLAIRDLLVIEARRTPLILILEDLHWADETSLDLISFLIDTIHQEPILVLALARPNQEEGLHRLLERADRYMRDRFVRIHLQSLTPNQSEKLLLLLLSVPDLPENLYTQVIQKAAGNPLYLEEIIRMLIDEKLISYVGDRWNLTPEASTRTLGVPETLQELILARFDRLNETQRRLLQVAAVIGRSFNARVLADVLQTDDETVIEEGLKQLVEREFIIPHLESSANDYLFKHAIVSDTIYATLLKSERSELHTLVGDALEKLYAGRLEEHIELLARHYSWGTRLDRALYYLILAGEKSVRGYANQQARQHFEAALDLLKKVPHSSEQELQVLTGLGDMLVLSGEYVSARSQYQAARYILHGKDKSSLAARTRLYRKISTTHERQGDFDQALASLVDAQNILDTAPQSLDVERAWLLNETGWIHSRRGRLDDAEKAFLQALALVEDLPEYDVIASIYNRLGGIYFQQDSLEKASSYVRKSLVLRQEIGDLNAVARSYNNLGLLGWRRGEWDSALEYFKRSLDLHSTLGDVEGTIALHSNLGLLYLDRGDFNEAQKHLEIILGTAQRIGHAFYTGLAHLYFSRFYLLYEEWQDALDSAQKSLQVFEELKVKEYLVDIATNSGMAYLELKDLEKAHYYARKALEEWAKAGTGSLASPSEARGRALRLLGLVSLARQELDGADRALQESADIFGKLENQVELGRTMVAQAHLAIAKHDEAGARRSINEARRIFRLMGARADLRKVETLSARLAERSPVAHENKV